MPVTVSEIGLRIKKSFLRYENLPLSMGASTRTQARPDLLPVRINAGDEHTIERRLSKDSFFKYGRQSFPGIRKATAVYVRVATGKEVRARNGCLKRFVERACENFDEAVQ